MFGNIIPSAPPAYDLNHDQRRTMSLDTRNYRQNYEHNYGQNNCYNINSNNQRSLNIRRNTDNIRKINYSSDLNNNLEFVDNTYGFNAHTRNSLLLDLNIDNLTSEEKLDFIIRKYNIHHLFSEHMSILKNYKIILCVDDSSSMNKSIVESSSDNVITRIDEVKIIIDMLINITKIYDEEGLDIHFLNKNPLFNVRNYEHIQNIIDRVPSGHTPLRHIVKGIFHYYKYYEKPILLVIATDGLPTDNKGNENLVPFVELLKKRDHDRYYVSFLSCSEVEEDMHYLTKLNKDIEHLSILNTYNKENNIITTIKGASYRYTKGDHLARLLLTPIVKNIDIVEELGLYKYKKRSIKKLRRHKNKRKRVNKKNFDCIIL